MNDDIVLYSTPFPEETETENVSTEEPIEFYFPDVHEKKAETYTLKIKSNNNEFTIENLSMNGTNYVSKTKVDTIQWPEIFELIVESDSKRIEHYEHARLIQQTKHNQTEEWYLIFSSVSNQEIESMKMKSDIEYLSMMTDIEIE